MDKIVGIIVVDCRGNLCNVGATFKATRYYQNINRSKIKIAENRCFSDDNTLSFSLQNFCQESLGRYTGLLAVQCCPKSIRTTLNKFSSCEMLSGASWTTLHKGFTCAILSEVFRTTLHKDFTFAILSQEC